MLLLVTMDLKVKHTSEASAQQYREFTLPGAARLATRDIVTQQSVSHPLIPLVVNARTAPATRRFNAGLPDTTENNRRNFEARGTIPMSRPITRRQQNTARNRSQAYTGSHSRTSLVCLSSHFASHVNQQQRAHRGRR